MFPVDKVQHFNALGTHLDPVISHGKLKMQKAVDPRGPERKKTVLENSNRILFGHRPGKKKKKRCFKQDLAIWCSPA